jgi:hypothetical protein
MSVEDVQQEGTGSEPANTQATEACNSPHAVTTTKTNVVLIDFENVQPRNLALLLGGDFRVYCFVGENQTKLPYDLAAAMQELGGRGQYIKIAGNGPNALDFHIAYYLGELIREYPEGYFHIISKDTGFDPLIEHLRRRQIQVHRERDLAEIPPLRLPAAAEGPDRLDAVVKNLAGRGASRPRKMRTLTNTIGSLFRPKLDDGQSAALVHELRTRGYIAVNGDNVSYRLPK